MNSLDSCLTKYIKDKDVLILGFGREGRSTFKKIASLNVAKTVTIADIKDIGDKETVIDNFVNNGGKEENLRFAIGEKYQAATDECDVCFKSPGIVLDREFSSYSSLIIGETDVFLEAYGDKTIAVTGTKGKSTTSSMIAHVLKEDDKNVLFAGNIGLPVFEIADEVKDDTIIVLELSCHQLEYARFSPHVAVLLNIYEDHLDHYKTRERYAASKKNIYRHQKESDYLFTLEETLKECDNVPSKVNIIKIDDAPFLKLSDTRSKLKGEHNRLNAAFAYEVCRMYDVTREEFLAAFDTFTGLHHRLEYIGTKDGIDYYDDSISTTVKSAISAIESVDNAKIILLGGMERNLNYDELIDYLVSSKLDNVVFMYDSGKRMYDMYVSAKKDKKDAPNCFAVKDLSEAVSKVKEIAVKGNAVILSPAAASYDHFKNFEERGDVFKSLIFC